MNEMDGDKGFNVKGFNKLRRDLEMDRINEFDFNKIDTRSVSIRLLVGLADLTSLAGFAGLTGFTGKSVAKIIVPPAAVTSNSKTMFKFIWENWNELYGVNCLAMLKNYIYNTCTRDLNINIANRHNIQILVNISRYCNWLKLDSQWNLSNWHNELVQCSNIVYDRIKSDFQDWTFKRAMLSKHCDLGETSDVNVGIDRESKLDNKNANKSKREHEKDIKEIKTCVDKFLNANVMSIIVDYIDCIQQDSDVVIQDLALFRSIKLNKPITSSKCVLL